MKRRNFGKTIGTALVGLYLLCMTTPALAGGYAPDVTQTAFPESDGNAGVVALVVFGIIFGVGIIQILTKKWQDRGKGDKE